MNLQSVAPNYNLSLVVSYTMPLMGRGDKRRHVGGALISVTVGILNLTVFNIIFKS